MVLAARFRFALLAGSVALLSAIGCTPKPEEPPARAPEPVLLPAVARIEIVPTYMSVPAGTAFTLRAQLRDAYDNVLSDPRTESVQWQTTQGAFVAPGASGSVVVHAPSSATATPSIKVVASLNGLSATNTIGIVTANSPTSTTPPQTPSNPGVTPAPDWIRAPHMVNDWPSIALVDGTSAGKNYNDSTFAFAESRELATFDCSGAMCGEITIFSPRQGIRRDTVGWKTGCDYVDFAGGAAGVTGCTSPAATSVLSPLPPLVHVPVLIWQASNAPGVDNAIADDIAYAKSVFNQPWTGLVLDVKVEIAWAASSPTYLNACDDPVHDITNQLVGIPDTAFRPYRVTVAYVDDISGGAIAAFACPYDPVEGPVALISESGMGGSTLAHELGHALGQWFADSTLHTDHLPKFDKSNLMWSEESDDSRSIRKHLTLGQLFQISLRDSSFVRRLPGSVPKGLLCPPKPGSDTPCPAFAKDP